MDELIYKSHNQHRRALYFSSFRRLHSLAKRVLKVCKDLESDAISSRRKREARDIITFAVPASLPLCRRVMRPHQGAGFAGLGTIIVASSAVYYKCMREILEGFPE